ncbi:hypothetical protein [Actinoplanes sp. NPDC051494]|uniref:hypothetical protein n=1 Tax=Actinoplanes sp. NPDC051494 TaxID=3363907 RepID=UPI0037B3EF75
MISPTDPDKAFTINGVSVTGRQLAEARQELSHRGVHNPHWAELSQHDQDIAALAAGNWLRALADLVPTADAAERTSRPRTMRRIWLRAAKAVGEPERFEIGDEVNIHFDASIVTGVRRWKGGCAITVQTAYELPRSPNQPRTCRGSSPSESAS